jgi:hypothetical protein
MTIIRRMRFACWLPRATDTHSEYVILIAFPRQQWLCKRVSMLRYMYIPFFIYPLLIHKPINSNCNQLTFMPVVFIFFQTLLRIFQT